MAAQVLDISKHDNAVRQDKTWTTTRPAGKRTRARLYRFPLPALPANDPPAAPKRRSRLHLALEVAIGFAIWLTWFLWQHVH